MLSQLAAGTVAWRSLSADPCPGMHYVLIIGSAELDANTSSLTVKDLETGAQTTVPFES